MIVSEGDCLALSSNSCFQQFLLALRRKSVVRVRKVCHMTHTAEISLISGLGLGFSGCLLENRNMQNIGGESGSFKICNLV